MKSRVVILIILIPLSIISCKKEPFPDNEDLVGNWVEITDFLYKEQLTFDDEDTLFYFTYWSRLIPGRVDTFLYRMDKEQERLFLTPVTSPGASESSHKMLLDKEANELTVWGLIVSLPENETKFKKQ